MNSENLAWTQIIHDRLLYVSSMVIYDYHVADMVYDRYETCIFSDIPGISFNIIFHNSEKQALRVHKCIVKSLKKKLGIR